MATDAKTQATSEEIKGKLKPRVIELADKIVANATVDNKLGVITEDGDSSATYHSNLPDGLTPDSVKNLNDYNRDFVSAGTIASGRLALDAFNENKDLTVVTSTIGMGAGSEFAATIERERSYTTNMSGTPTTTVKHGVVTPVFTTLAGKNDASAKHARGFVNALFAEALSSKKK